MLSPLPDRSTAWAALQRAQTRLPASKLRQADADARSRVHERIRSEAAEIGGRALVRYGPAAIAAKLSALTGRSPLTARMSTIPSGSTRWEQAVLDALEDHLVVSARSLLKLPPRPSPNDVFADGNKVAHVYGGNSVNPEVQAGNLIRLNVAVALGHFMLGVPPQPFRQRVMSRVRLALVVAGRTS
jgi:hypothetical protein